MNPSTDQNQALHVSNAAANNDCSIEEVLGFYGEDLTESFAVPLLLINAQGQILVFNKSAQDLVGMTSTEIIGNSLARIMGEKPGRHFMEQLNIQQHELAQYSVKLLTKEKTAVPLDIKAKRARNSIGRTVGYVLAALPCQNAGEALRKLSDTRLADKQNELETTKRAFANMLSEADDDRQRIGNEQQKTRATLMGLEDGVVLLDGDGNISLVNTQAEKILEVEEAAVLGKRLPQLSEHARIVQLHQVLESEKAASQTNPGTTQPVLGKKEFTLGEQQKKYYQLSITQAATAANNFGTIVELHDITQEKIIDRMKSEFISIAAHQLRTPLTGINWSLDAALTGEVGDISPELRRLLQQATETAMHMTQVINDLLNVSRLEQNRSAFDFAIISPDEPLRKAFSGLMLRAKTCNTQLKWDVPASLPQVKADSMKLQMAFYNLIENAIKYSQAGGMIEVSATTAIDEVKSVKSVQITIKDSGIGINTEEQERIFTKFFRANNAVRLQTEGSGLGLFIVRQIIDGHGGRIWFDSKEGQGTTFYISLPAMDGYVVPQPATGA